MSAERDEQVADAARRDRWEVDYQEALRRWAQWKFPEGGPVTKVEIEHGYDWGYSEYTPGEGLEFGVAVTFENGLHAHKNYGENAGEFMRELVAFAPRRSESA
jgi:hypothetical protein